jgi:hypothetical protein
VATLASVRVPAGVLWGKKKGVTPQLRQRGTTVHLWRITVVDSPDETLLRMVMKDGKVDGFSVH